MCIAYSAAVQPSIHDESTTRAWTRHVPLKSPAVVHCGVWPTITETLVLPRLRLARRQLLVSPYRMAADADPQVFKRL